MGRSGYALFHLNGYDAPSRFETEERLRKLAPCFHLSYADDDTRLFEIVQYPH
jgi:hypothetical protein